ncbi:MAG: hypothetical protein R3A10_02525 [Caldilineaceae bacterium]
MAGRGRAVARICWLVAHHQATNVDAPDPDAADLLAALQWADGIN